MSGQLQPPQLIRLVKMLQQYSYPLDGCRTRWGEFLQSQQQQHGGTKDPAKLELQVLKDFIMSLMDPGFLTSTAHQPQQPQQQGDQQPAVDMRHCVTRNQGLVSRFIKWILRVDKEYQKRAFSAPPPASHTKFTPPSTPTQPSRPPPPARPLNAWDLVHATRAHARYHQLFNLPSYRPGWARTKRRVVTRPVQGPGSVRPRLFALDCEMVHTADGDDNSLVNLSVVDEMGRVVYTSKVKPRHPVVDFRTEVTGLHQEDLEALLLDSFRSTGVPSILVGHSLHNDLQALRLDHQPCIDTSLIFSYKNLPTTTPSLRDLHQLVLGTDMEARKAGRHDSTEDAYAAMKLVLHELTRTERTQPLPAPTTKADRDQLRCLLVHSIPHGVTEQQLLDLFLPMLMSGVPGSTADKGLPQPATHNAVQDDSDLDSDSSSCTNGDEVEEEVELQRARQMDVEADGQGVAAMMAGVSKVPVITTPPTFTEQPGVKNGRATLMFKHAGEANAAFSALLGALETDITGRRQKKVTLSPGVTIKIRKIAGHNGYVFSQSAKVSKVVTKPSKAKKGPSKGSEGVSNGVVKMPGRKTPPWMRTAHVPAVGVVEGAAEVAVPEVKGEVQENSAVHDGSGQKQGMPARGGVAKRGRTGARGGGRGPPNKRPRKA